MSLTDDQLDAIERDLEHAAHDKLCDGRLRERHVPALLAEVRGLSAHAAELEDGIESAMSRLTCGAHACGSYQAFVELRALLDDGKDR